MPRHNKLVDKGQFKCVYQPVSTNVYMTHKISVYKQQIWLMEADMQRLKQVYTYKTITVSIFTLQMCLITNQKQLHCGEKCEAYTVPLFDAAKCANNVTGDITTRRSASGQAALLQALLHTNRQGMLSVHKHHYYYYYYYYYYYSGVYNNNRVYLCYVSSPTCLERPLVMLGHCLF